VRLVKGTAVYTAAFTPSTTPLTAISGTSLLTSQSNRFIDTSSNAFTITVNGNTNIQRFSPFSPTAAYSAATMGGSAYFDGTGDLLTVPFNQTPLLLSNSDFTFECWVYRNNTNTASIYTGQSDLNTAAGSGFVFYVSSSASSDLYSGGTGFSITSPNPQVNAWAHVAWCRTGGTYSSYLNGVRIGTLSSISTNAVNNGSASNLGGFGGFASGSAMLNGYIAGARFIKGSGGYTATDSTITIPTAPPTAITNTSLLLNYTNAGIIDNAMINNIETVGDAKISTTQSKFGGSSMFFDGNGDYLSVPPNQNLVFGVGDFTVELWFRTQTTVDQIIFDMRPPLANGAYPTLYYTTGTLIWFTNLDNRVISGAIAQNTWYHVAVSRSGTSTRMFINGVQAGSTYTDSTNYLCDKLFVGASSSGSGAVSVFGYIDDLRITKGVARYTSNFTPPANALPTQ
jgi:hypothetical protein